MSPAGAIACGMETVGLKRKPKEMARKQALASVGQIVLMSMYMDAFAGVGLTASQILLTHEDTKSRSRCLNLMNTIDTLLGMGVVPIVNENDTLSFKEIMFGDNDNLSALIAQIGNADLLVLLSDVEGLYEKDPKRVSRRRHDHDGQKDRRARRGPCPRDDERKERRRHDEQAGGGAARRGITAYPPGLWGAT